MWSIGVITYILVSGSRPFWAQTESGIFKAVLRANPSLNGFSYFADHPWIRDYEQVKIPLDILVYKHVKNYICSSTPLRKTALKVKKHI